MSNTIAARLSAIRTEMAKSNLDAFIIPRADEYLGEYVPAHNERMLWSSGFTGSAGMIIVLKDSAAIFVDGRYTVQVRQQVDAELFEYLSLHDTPQAQWLTEKLSANANVGFDARLHTLSWFNNTRNTLSKALIELVAVKNNPLTLTGAIDHEHQVNLSWPLANKVLAALVSKNAALLALQ